MVYDGTEGVWTDETLDWVAYASHKGHGCVRRHVAERLGDSWTDLADRVQVP